MGEIADMMLEGILCQFCGEYLGDGDSVPASCPSCNAGEDDILDDVGMPEEKPDRWEKRQSNREWSTNHLEELGVQFETKNQGRHLIITHNLRTVDFWPGTGKYIFRKEPINGRGIRNLLKELKIK